MAPNRWFAASPNTDYIYKALTDGTVTNLTGGRIPKMNAAQAAGLVGSWLIETGRKDLSNLDVVEAGSGRGRGLSQYTGVRRTPYDQAVQQARAAGRDPNSAQWQIEYFAKEYMNRDLIGWTKVFERMPQNLKSPGEYAKYFTGSAAEGKGYFRPGVPHTDRRMQAAQEVYSHYSAPKPTAPAPTTTAPAPQGSQGGNPATKFLQDTLKKLGIKGGNQSFDTNKMERVMGAIASNAAPYDIGLAIFSATNGGSRKSWNKLNNKTKTAYGKAGAQLAINSNPNYYAPNQGGGSRNIYTMPRNDLKSGSGSTSYNNRTNSFNYNNTRAGSGGSRGNSVDSRNQNYWKNSNAAASWENSSYSWDRGRRNDLNSSWRDAGKNLSVSGGNWGYNPSNAPGMAVGTVSPVGAPGYGGVSYSGGNPLG